MRLVPGPPGVKLGGHSYCCDFGKSFLNTKTIKALILPDFILMKTLQEVEMRHCSNFIETINVKDFPLSMLRNLWFTV